MAFNLASGGGDSEPIAEINTTPLIDVMLVLLIMLIITIPIQLHAVNLNLPSGNPPVPAAPPEVVRIDIDADSTIRWNGDVVGDRQALETRLTVAAVQAVQPELHVRPNRDVAYGSVAEVMASVQRLGLTKIGIVGSEQFN